MGSLVNCLPLLFFVFSLDPWFYGVSFFNSLYSKDLILEFAYSCYVLDGDFIYFLGVISALFTCFYSLRLLFFVFFNDIVAFLFI